MKPGLIGLGRMGANMSRRWRRDGHTVIGYARTAATVEGLVADGAIYAAARPRSPTSSRSCRDAARPVADGPGGLRRRHARAARAAARRRRHRHRRRQLLVSATTSAAPTELAPGGHPLRRLRHERRRVGPRARATA